MMAPAGGKRGRAYLLGPAREPLLPAHTRFLLPQPLGGTGQASDITIEAEEILKMRERINRIIARETGQTYEKIVTDTDRNFWIGAQDAVAYGLISKIVARTDEA